MRPKLTTREESTLRKLARRELRYGRMDRRDKPMNSTLTLAECARLDALRRKRDGVNVGVGVHVGALVTHIDEPERGVGCVMRTARYSNRLEQALVEWPDTWRVWHYVRELVAERDS